jgi:hypothetical protein
MVKILKVKPIMTEEAEEALLGVKVANEHCKQLIDYDCDVYDKETGACLAKFRKSIIPASVQLAAYKNLLAASKPSLNRGMALGEKNDNGKVRQRALLKDGRLSKQSVTQNAVNSGIVGYYDRTARLPVCRLTAYTQQHWEKFVDAYPIMKFVDDQYSKLMPAEYKKQKRMADKVPGEWVIGDTSFSTVTVNKNYSTAAHRDAGDYKEGFGNLVALRKGKYEGCYFTFLRWGIGFDLQNGDLLMCDVHRVHGNTPMVAVDKGATRLSLVMYLRERMVDCLPFADELDRAKKRKKGDKL